MFDSFFSAFDRLGERGYAIIDGFLSPDQIEQLLQRFDVLAAAGAFDKAGIGKLQHHNVDRAIRGDYIHWVEPTLHSQPQPEEKLVDTIRALREWLNRHYFLALKDEELHLAYYPPGTFYKRHTDQFKQQQHRVLSVVLYLNRGWQPEHGGALRLYLPGEGTIEVEPLAGRLLVFRSHLEHEVLPTQVDRFSFTGWLLDQELGVTFL